MKLDHLYFGNSASDFEITKSIYPTNSFTKHQVINTTDDSWEGLYVYCQNKTYFEFLRERRNYKFGMAFKSETPMEEGMPIEVKLQGQLPWKYGTRYFENGSFWFNWFALENTRDLSIPFAFWIMQYDYRYLNRLQSSPTPKSPYQYIEKVNLISKYSLRKRFQAASLYFKEKINDTEKNTLFIFDNTSIQIEWVDHQNQDILLKKLKFST